MLIQLKMTNWRKHVNKTINFTAGLNAIRGANENGKSSMLWAISYALWGAKILPLPMAEMVTWGQSEKDAKVELVMSAGGEMYHFSRSPNGAECNHSGGVVTGQNEVSKFATELLRVPPDMAMKLMFSTQGGLRGALDAGPTAISAYIEDMSGMDLFDRLLDIIGEKLVTGPTALMDTQVASLQELLEKGGPVAPDMSELDATEVDLIKTLSAAEIMVAGAEVAATTANNVYTEAKAKADVRATALRNLNAAEVNRDRRLAQQETDSVAAAKEVDEARIEELGRLITNGSELQARKQGYTAFSALPTIEVEWEGDETSLKGAIQVSAKAISDAKQTIGKLEGDIRVLDSQKTTSSICGFCDQDLSKFPEVAKKNADIETKILAKRWELSTAATALSTAIEENDALQGVMEAAQPAGRFLQKFGAMVSVDHDFVPPRIVWVGSAPESVPDVASMQAELKTLKAALATKTAAAVRLEQVEKDLAQDEVTIAALQEAIPGEVDLTELLAAKQQADADVTTSNQLVRTTREKLQSLSSNKSRLLAEHRVAEKQFAQVAISLEAKKKERDELVFNNTLVKKIKAARPVVASKLWSLVLTSVSVMFSNMRGEQSVVTKGPKGFLVNGRPSDALSGSALDLLGFAIRVAMLNTFIPSCSFLILDEATSACDDERTASLLGFIAGAGFPQTLLVTHEAASESVADNVVMI